MSTKKSEKHRSSEEDVAVAAWTRLGASFNVPPAKETPDLERLLLDTVRLASGNSRLFIMAATWLSQYSDYVAKRRLEIVIKDELEERYKPSMGFLLDVVNTHCHRHQLRFREAIQACHSASIPGPLLKVSRRNSTLMELARQRASALSRKWGCWMEEV